MTGTSQFHGVDTPLEWIRISMSLGLLIFSSIILSAIIVHGETKVSRDMHPTAAGCIMWACTIWMSIVEGGQACMVGLPPVDRELYKESHPITYHITGRSLIGDNMDRYLMGRQSLVIFLNFTISLCGAPLPGATVMGLPTIVTIIFLESSLAMVLQTVIVGQLTSQVNASHCMLDYINNHFMTFTLYVSFFIEFTGLMHTSYLIHYACCYLGGKPVQSNEPPRSSFQKVWFWGRVMFSMVVLCYSMAVTIEALLLGQTTMAVWGIPNGLSLVLFFILLCLAGLLEGMQIAFCSVAKLPKSEVRTSSIALRTCECLFQEGGKNLPGFMCGRQLAVTMCFFVIARVTTVDVQVGSTPNIFGVSDMIQNLFNTGFLGAIVTTNLGSISWQFVALSFPIEFLSNPLVLAILKFCLWVEDTGICAACWFLAMIQKKLMRFQFDEEYIGSPKERASRNRADDPDAVRKLVHIGTATIAPTVGTHEVPREYLDLAIGAMTYTARREQCLQNIKQLREKIQLSATDDERAAYTHALQLQVASLEDVNREEAEAASSQSNLDTVVEMQTESDGADEESQVDKAVS